MNPRPERPGAGRIGLLLGQVAREPLTHFLLIGLAIFATAVGVREARRPVLRVDEAELRQLSDYWQMQMQRPPTAEELRGIVRERIDEEILAQEAKRRGLDRDDIIIRRRLAQKMAFASEDTAQIAEPDDAALKALYDRTAGQYATPAHLGLRQVFFSAERGEAPARRAAEAALARLRAGATDVSGDPLVLPLAYADVTLPDLIRDYGEDFAHWARTAPTGAWGGPVRSAYGWHLVRIESRSQVVTPPFEQVRGQVRDAWLQDQRRHANATMMDQLRARYRIEVAAAPARAGAPVESGPSD
jgi:parvulin-like peptidyl-prolyl isomerase